MPLNLRQMQSRFRDAVLRGDDAAVTSLLRANASNGLAVHRNTVRASLAEVLGTAYPVVQRIAGAAVFAQIAEQFVMEAPPRVPQLCAYGDGFAAFIARTEIGRRLPYLADVARLEWARAEVYFAADADSLDPAQLATTAPDDLDAVVLKLHPATRLVASRFPIYRVWNDALHDDPETGETVLVSRTAHRLHMRLLSGADAAFIDAVTRGEPLGKAADCALAFAADFDLQAALAAHFSSGTFRAL